MDELRTFWTIFPIVWLFIEEWDRHLAVGAWRGQFLIKWNYWYVVPPTHSNIIIGLERKTEIEIFPPKVKVGEDFLFQDSTLNLRGLSGGDRSFW